MTVQHEITCIAPVNIAVIKYWGKVDTERILPTNESLSVTLNTRDLHTKTTVRADPSYDQDRLWLNGQETDVQKNMRLTACLKELRSMRERMEEETGLDVGLASFPLHVVTINNFPTAAGLASSASGFACLVYAIARLYGLITDESNMEHVERISAIARQGSGSACRSLMGGYVKWHHTPTSTANIFDSDCSRAVQVAPQSHWPEMRAFILVTNDAKKAVSSTAGMQTTVQTSRLFQHRIQHDVPKRMEAMQQAIINRDFQSFGRLTMEDSNSFHAVCLDTYPPIFYLNDTSKQIIQLVHAYNEAAGHIRVAYTFDAGPNAVLYLLEKEVESFLSHLATFFLEHDPVVIDDARVKEAMLITSNRNAQPLMPGSVKRIIYTSVGDGPQVVSSPLPEPTC